MPEQTQKTATGLSRLSEINTGIDKLLNAPAPSVDASTLPKPSAVPAEPPQMQDTSFATKLARSMSIFLAAQQNPENGMQLIKQYEAQDAAARDAVQQRFANATALAQMEQQRLQFSEDIRAGRMNEAQAAIDNTRQALELALRGVQLDIAAKEAAGGDTSYLKTQYEMLQDMVTAEEKRVGQSKGTDPREGLTEFKGIVAGAVGAGLSEQLKTFGTSEEANQKLIEGIIDFREKTSAGMKIKATPQMLAIHANLASNPHPIAQSAARAFESMVQALPDPRTGDKGDPAVVAANAAWISQNDPETAAAIEEAQIDWVLFNGLAKDPIEAAKVSAVITTDELTAEQAIARFKELNQGKGLLEKLLSGGDSSTAGLGVLDVLGKTVGFKSKKVIAAGKQTTEDAQDERDKRSKVVIGKNKAQGQMDSLFGSKKK